jgi:hypothetical protein
MINFITLNTITTDLLNIIRNFNVSKSENISKRQLEMWVHQYRALLIKQDIDKGKIPNPDYIQTLPALALEVVDASEGSDLNSESYILKTQLELPETIDFNFKSGFTYIGTVDGTEIQYIPEGRSKWQQYKKYTSNDNLAFLRDKHLYLIYTKPIAQITVRGIFVVPTEVMNFVNPHATETEGDWDDRYPIPMNMVPVLKDMILRRELGIGITMNSDNKNDSTNLVSSNVINQ